MQMKKDYNFTGYWLKGDIININILMSIYW